MHADSTLSPAAKLLFRHRKLLLAFVVLAAYAAAVPPSETFGSHHLEQLKDVLALSLVFLGLALRFLASGAQLEQRDLQSPFYAANLLILFGIFLMHGNIYVVVLGLLACAAIYRLVWQADRGAGAPPWISLLSRERSRLGEALAKEWPIIAASVCLLVLTEVYEELNGVAAASLHVALFILSGVAVLISIATLVVQLRHETALAPAADAFPGARANRRARTFPIRLSKTTADALLVPWARGFFWMAAFVLQFRHPYQSPAIAGGRAGKRDTETRWVAIASVIQKYQARSILDVGCAEGWFLRRAAAAFNCFGLGIDSYESRVMLGEAARLHAGGDRVAIMKGTLTADDVRELPPCDIVICLSVLHWVIRTGGLAAAQDFVRALISRAQKALLFEIGEAEALAQKFSDRLPPNANGEDFIRYLLTSAGVTNIRVIASSPDINDAYDRQLFVGEPALGEQAGEREAESDTTV